MSLYCHYHLIPFRLAVDITIINDVNYENLFPLIPTYTKGLQDLITPANEKYLSLLHTISKLVGYVTGARKFSAENHLLDPREEMRDRQKNMGWRQWRQTQGNSQGPLST